MRNTFTGYSSGWDRCEDCGQRLSRFGDTGLRHPRKGVSRMTGLQIHEYVMTIKALTESRRR